MKGSKREVKSAKQSLGLTLDEGKKPMSKNVYRKLCEWLFQSNDKEHIFVHLSLVSKEFSVSSYYFETSISNGVGNSEEEELRINANFDKYLKDRLLSVGNMNAQTFLLVKSLFAALSFHYDYIEKYLHYCRSICCSTMSYFSSYLILYLILLLMMSYLGCSSTTSSSDVIDPISLVKSV